MTEDFDHLLPFDHFLNVAVERADSCLLALKVHAALAADALDHHQHDEEKGDGDEGQHPVEIEHHAEDTHKGERAGDKSSEAAIDHFADGLDIVGEAAHELTVGAAVEETQGEGLHLAEEIITQSGNRALGDEDHDAVGAEAHQRTACVHRAHDSKLPRETGEVTGDDIVIDEGLEQITAENAAEGAADDTDRYKQEQEFVLADVAHELSNSALQIAGALKTVLVTPTGTGRRTFSHGDSPLPAAADRPRGKCCCFAAALHGCPWQRCGRHP